MVSMAGNDFNKLRVEDGRITKLVVEGMCVFLSIRDWQDNTIDLTFAEVIGIEGFGIVNVDLGGASESSNDPLIEKACSILEEPIAGFNCYTLFSAWNEQPLIKVVARSWTVTHAVSSPRV
jgi:hypothetical protein